MCKRLRSVGIDVGTTSTQLVVSELLVRNEASAFSVPRMEITQRRILYRGAVHFTPLLEENRIDGAALGKLIRQEYARAGIDRNHVDTGAVIITGETSRKENARAVLEGLAELAGDFVVATAGPDLESVLAARGAGADRYSREQSRTVLHMDIGGGTSNLALLRDGEILQTGCLNVGGRLLKYGPDHILTYVSPVLQSLISLRPGMEVTQKELDTTASLLVEALEMAAGLRQRTELLDRLITNHTVVPESGMLLSFSGGVADCIAEELPWDRFGDLGPRLGSAIRNSRLCAGEYALGRETIRATVIGAGCHSTQLSGSTVFCRGIDLPIKNKPVVRWDPETGSQLLEQKVSRLDTDSVLALTAETAGDYETLTGLGQQILEAVPRGPLLLAMEADHAKALGQILALRTDRPILCMDGVRLTEDCYLDVGEPVGPAFPLVVKTLIFRGTT